MIVPVTTGGKKRSMRLTSGAIRMPMTPAPMIEPNSSRAPSAPGLAAAIDTIGPTEAKVTPIMTGSLTPNHCVAPSDWIMVTMPQQNKVCRNQEGDLLRIELQRASDDERHGDGAGIHHQHVLHAEREPAAVQAAPRPLDGLLTT